MSSSRPLLYIPATSGSQLRIWHSVLWPRARNSLLCATKPFLPPYRATLLFQANRCPLLQGGQLRHGECHHCRKPPGILHDAWQPRFLISSICMPCYNSRRQCRCTLLFSHSEAYSPRKSPGRVQLVCVNAGGSQWLSGTQSGPAAGQEHMIVSED
jgi:hypothetical protein